MARLTLPTRSRRPIGRLTDAGLWAVSAGDPPHVVTLRENRAAGKPLVWDYEGHRARRVGERIVVRKPDGKGGWEWDVEAAERAERLAKERHHERALQLSAEDAFTSSVKSEFADLAKRLAPLIRPDVAAHAWQRELDRSAVRVAQIPRGDSGDGMITVEEGFALFHDPKTGGLKGSPNHVYQHQKARELWTAELRDARTGASLPWNSVTLADVEAVAARFKLCEACGRGDMPAGAPKCPHCGHKHPQRIVWGERMVHKLSAVHGWLRKKRRMRELQSPTEGFDVREYGGGYVPREPRYTAIETRKLMQVRREIDPRFALMLVLARFAGDRSKAYRVAMRSMVDQRLDAAPDPSQAPHGWIVLPSLKGGHRPIVFLTARQRSELNWALSTFLRDLERRYQETNGEADYPLFPGVWMNGERKGATISVDNRAAMRPVGYSTIKMWLIKAEERAGVERIDQRKWHGLRRTANDDQVTAVGLEATSAARGWTNSETLRKVYLDKQNHDARAKVRAAMEEID